MYTVNLDEPPAVRWKEVIDAHMDTLPRVQDYLQASLRCCRWSLTILTQGMMKSIEAETLGDSAFYRMMYSMYTCVNGDFLTLARKLCEENNAIDFEEVQAVANLAQIELGDFCMLQCAYEVAARCTSIVAPLESTAPCHARTMDWGALFLRYLSCEVHFTRNGQEIYRSSTWAGYLGPSPSMARTLSRFDPVTCKVRTQSPKPSPA